MTPAGLHRLFAACSAITGLTLDDITEQAMAKTPEEEAQIQGRNIRKMAAHQRGVPLEEIPDFVNYPETGLPA